MNNLENLKHELLSQKNLIEKGGGYVVVSGTNPSPSEITEGIKTIAGSDLTIATATEDDVRLGKTFFAGGPELKTGTVSLDTDSIHHIFMAPPSTQSTDKELYYTCPENINNIKRYCFENNFNKIHFKFKDNIEQIKDYAFYNAKNMVFEDFDKLTKLTRVCPFAFYSCNGESLDLENLPSSLTYIDESAFANVLRENGNIKIPEGTASTGMAIFKIDSRRVAGTFEIDSTKLTSLSGSMLYNIAFNCDFICPVTVKTVSSYFNYNGCFHNVVLHENVTLSSYCFGASASRPVSDFYLRSIVFEGENPPSIGSNAFATQNIENGLKIYVPDNSVEAYKAVANLSRYVDIIYPISQKE